MDAQNLVRVPNERPSAFAYEHTAILADEPAKFGPRVAWSPDRNPGHPDSSGWIRKDHAADAN